MTDSNAHWRRYVSKKLGPLGLRPERETDVVEELVEHLVTEYEAALARGASEDEASEAAQKLVADWRLLEAELARAEHSSVGQYLHRSKIVMTHAPFSKSSRASALMESFFQDLRYGFRSLLKKPGFAAVAVLTLGLGLGAVTAIFSVVYAVLLGPLPYHQPEQLALIWSDFQQMGASRTPASPVQMREIRARSNLLHDLAGIRVASGTLTDGEEAEQIKLASVTTNFFDVLGARPLLGSSFSPEDQNPRSGQKIILSYGLWQRRFGGDPAVVGKEIHLQGRGITVAGVMPADFRLLFPPDAGVPLDTQAWVPFTSDIYSAPVDLYYIRLLGRLKPGVSFAQAQAEANSIAQQLREQFGEFGGENLQLQVVPMRGDAVRDLRPALLSLLGGALLVLLISCVNVASLLLSQASARRREIALRAALGATRWRIARQLLSESLVLCFLGVVAGLGIGWAGIELLLAVRPEGLARIGPVGLNWPVLGFVTVVSLLCAVLFGMAPALEGTKLNLTESLKGAGRTTAGAGNPRARKILVMSEVALGIVLLIGAGLMMRTVSQIQNVNPGFKTAGVLTFELNLNGRDYASLEQRKGFVTRWEEKLRSMPGVEAVGAISHLPLDDYPNWYSPYAPEGLTEDQKKGLMADHRCVTTGFFQAVGARLVAGRYFDDHDQDSSRPVVIVDEMLARQTWPGQNAVGKRIQAEHFKQGAFTQEWAEIIGVVEHVRNHSLTKQVRGEIYIPYPQSARPRLSYAVKTNGDPLVLASAVRQELRAIDKSLALSKVRPLQDYVDRDIAKAQFSAVLAGIFGGVALLLAAVGVYGVTSYGVSQRVQEIGVRMALGAQPRSVLLLVIRQGLTMILIGGAVGLCAAVWITRLLSGLLFGVSATDPLTFLAAPSVLILSGLLACYVPARRATRIDPLKALRAE